MTLQAMPDASNPLTPSGKQPILYLTLICEKEHARVRHSLNFPAYRHYYMGEYYEKDPLKLPSAPNG